MTIDDLFRLAIFSAALLGISCGRTAAPAGVETPAATAAAAAKVEAAPVLAVALEGDVLMLSETEYRAKGPEIRCSAFLIRDETAAPIMGLAEWRVFPAGAGFFSTGATGVFFIPEGTGVVEIEAELEHEGRHLRSPRLRLHVAAVD